MKKQVALPYFAGVGIGVGLLVASIFVTINVRGWLFAADFCLLFMMGYAASSRWPRGIFLGLLTVNACVLLWGYLHGWRSS